MCKCNTKKREKEMVSYIFEDGCVGRGKSGVPTVCFGNTFLT